MKKIRGKETDTKDKEFKIKNTSKINLEKKKIGEEDEENQRKKTENTKPTVYPEILISEKISWISLDTWGISIFYLLSQNVGKSIKRSFIFFYLDDLILRVFGRMRI
ncbi:hypothetical protein RhiirA4_440206, partial [Rhizophagus irregularis]